MLLHQPYRPPLWQAVLLIVCLWLVILGQSWLIVRLERRILELQADLAAAKEKLP